MNDEEGIMKLFDCTNRDRWWVGIPSSTIQSLSLDWNEWNHTNCI